MTDRERALAALDEAIDMIQPRLGTRLREENAKLKARIAALTKELNDQEREFQHEARDIAAEAGWKAHQGEDYDSY